MARKVQNKKGAHYCRSLVQSQKSAHHLLMKAKTYSSSSELHGADEEGYLSFGVVDAWHGVAYAVRYHSKVEGRPEFTEKYSMACC